MRPAHGLWELATAFSFRAGLRQLQARSLHHNVFASVLAHYLSVAVCADDTRSAIRGAYA